MSDPGVCVCVGGGLDLAESATLVLCFLWEPRTWGLPHCLPHLSYLAVTSLWLSPQGFQGKTGPPGPPGVVGPQVCFPQERMHPRLEFGPPLPVTQL